MNKKAFTLVEMLAVIVILGLLVTMTVGIYNSYLSSSRYKSFQIAEESFINATKEAYLDCSSNHPSNTFCNIHSELYHQGDHAYIYLKELVADDYIEAIKNPYDTDSFCDMDRSYVYANVENSYQGSMMNMSVSYTVCLICGEHQSETCQ